MSASETQSDFVVSVDKGVKITKTIDSARGLILVTGAYLSYKVTTELNLVWTGNIVHLFISEKCGGLHASQLRMSPTISALN